MTAVGQATPLATPVLVTERGAGYVVTTMWVDPADPIFAGHYPGFPIYPGVCLVECAHRSALAAAEPDGPVIELAGVDSARFRNPMYPGGEVITRLEFAERDGEWICSASLRSDQVELAVVKLRFRMIDPARS